MAHIPNGPVNSIKNKKELGDVLRGVGFFIGFVSILLLLIMLYAKSYKNSTELLIVVGIPGAISVVLLILGSIFAAKKEDSIFKQRRNRRS